MSAVGDSASLAASRRPRSADPYRDKHVVDERAPRFNQGFVAIGSTVALATGACWLMIGLALHQIGGLVFGRRFCLPCLAYFELVQPRIGEGRLEDARPPRFANVVGAVFMSAASIAFVVDVYPVGWALTGIVAALAALAATTGVCVGCALYRRVRGCETCEAGAAS